MKDKDIKKYNDLQSFENSNSVAIDFDGVIHKNSKGFNDGTIYDEPVEGSLEAIKKIFKKGYKIIIFTAKAKPDRPLVNGLTGEELVWDWLKKHNLKKYISDVTSEKPRAKIYIDDKGYRFQDWKNAMYFIESIENNV